MPINESAWNPGLSSTIPTRLWPKVTLFAPENAYLGFEEARELSDLTGLDVVELAALKPGRLLIHALLVRVTADLTVADGPDYAELGLNLRHMVKRLHSEHMCLLLPDIEQDFESLRFEAAQIINAKLHSAFSIQTNAMADEAIKKSVWTKWFRSKQKDNEPPENSETLELRTVEQWRKDEAGAGDTLHGACLKALIKCVDSIVSHRGQLIPDLELISRIAVNRVLNSQGCLLIDKAIDTVWEQAIEAEGFRCLPAQNKPVVMNVKGASASGKSSIRPQQRKLADKLDIAWEDFALISPDYWRKYLLDYDSLDQDHKYAAMLTGRELEIVDKKLDHYMAGKAQSGAMSHLLIDRFRFDSFVVDVDREAGSKLLSRFGDRIYLFFMVTHPAETVERAWLRGSTTGRYKAVDDLLYHNVEAFTGMPSLFLSWVSSKDKQIRFEYLDNDVAKGELPRTAAFGRNNTLIVLDMSLLLKVDSYRRVNIEARGPEGIFSTPDDHEQALHDDAFIRQCMKTVDKIIFADAQSMIEYALIESGALVWWNHDYIENASSAQVQVDLLIKLGYPQAPCDRLLNDFGSPLEPQTEKRFLVGHLGTPA